MRHLLITTTALLLAAMAHAQAPTAVNAEALKNKYNQQLTKQTTAVFEENKGQMKDRYWQPRPDVLYYGKSEGMNYYIRNTIEIRSSTKQILYKGKLVAQKK